jgi:hypothetical protein
MAGREPAGSTLSPGLDTEMTGDPLDVQAAFKGLSDTAGDRSGCHSVEPRHARTARRVVAPWSRVLDTFIQSPAHSLHRRQGQAGRGCHRGRRYRPEAAGGRRARPHGGVPRREGLCECTHMHTRQAYEACHVASASCLMPRIVATSSKAPHTHRTRPSTPRRRPCR